MDALAYELVIRIAFDVDRGTAHGADADIYRRWDATLYGIKLQKESISNGQPLVDSRSVEELEYQARVKAAEVRENVKRAISKVKSSASQNQNEKLAKLESMLGWDEYNKDVIDIVINETLKLFNELKLQGT